MNVPAGKDEYDGRVLRDPQKETFVREYIRTRKKVYAYRFAKGLDLNGKGGAPQANKWLDLPEIKHRIKSIQQGMMNKVSDAGAYTEAWVKDQTRALIDGGIKMQPVMARGVPVVDEIDGEEVPRMEFRDSSAAAKGLDMASKQLGLYNKIKEPDGNENKSDEELLNEYRALNDQLEGATKALTNAIDRTEGTEVSARPALRSVPKTD